MISALLRLIYSGLRDLIHHPWAQGLTLSAVTFVALLAGVFLLFVHNLNLQIAANQGELMYQVYWKPGSEQKLVNEQWASFEDLPYLVNLRTFTPEDALQALQKEAPEGVDLSWLSGSSPLPATALLSFSTEEHDATRLHEMTLTHLQGLAGVDKVRANPMKSETAQSWKRLSQRILLPLMLFLFGILALVVGNTMRLSLLRRTREVEILQLVGARGWYVRFPLLLESLLHGFLGGLIALGLLKLLQINLYDALHFPPLLLRVEFLPANQAWLLLLGPTLASLLSGWLAVRRLSSQ